MVHANAVIQCVKPIPRYTSYLYSPLVSVMLKRVTVAFTLTEKTMAMTPRGIMGKQMMVVKMDSTR